MTSPTFGFAAEAWRAIRADFEVYREGAYELAETETNGVLLNERGKAAGIDPYSLFIGPEVRAYAYASEELIDHWTRWGRMTFTEWERQHYEQTG